MPLVDEVRRICTRLADHGWAEVLGVHGLDIRSPDLAAELARELPTIDRSVQGFEDFAQEGVRGIEPGHPARSLLFHALASSNVVKRLDGHDLVDFATLVEIDFIENYVYGVVPPSLDDLRGRAGGAALAVVVFAVEYRPAADTCHKKHADLAFSRTGVARVGTAPALYSPHLRGFLPFVEEDPFAIRVLPARYGVYLAVRQRGSASEFCPMRFRRRNDDEGGIADDEREFWVPLHKLFPGPECLRDFTGDGAENGTGGELEVSLEAHHVNEKLRRIHLELSKPNREGVRFDTGWQEPDLSQAPFRFSEGIARWSQEESLGPGVLVPAPHAQMVEPARYREKPLAFNVPPDADTFSSSLRIPWNDGDAISAPEYVHVRHRVEPDGDALDGEPVGRITNLNTDLGLDMPALEAQVQQGGYKALHYLDFTGDGWVEARCPQLEQETDEGMGQGMRLPFVAAYSLVTAPDFYPTCDQRELTEWTASQAVPAALRQEIWLRPPEALSDDRMPPNLQLPGAPFDEDDDTATAIVSLFGEVSVAQTLPRPADALRHSHLPDDAAGLFAPGWDVGRDRNTNGVLHLAGYSLGSPFPEDAKLCAALSAFWPAVAPDATRTLSPRPNSFTASPLTDEEIGQVGNLPWDGIAGPRVVRQGGHEFAEYTSFAHADYVESALEGKFSLARTGRVNAASYQSRVLAMALVYRALGGEKKAWLLLSFREAVGDAQAAAELQEAQQQTGAMLLGASYRFDMARRGAESTPAQQPRKRRVQLGERVLLFCDPQHRRLLVSRDGTWTSLSLTL